MKEPKVGFKNDVQPTLGPKSYSLFNLGFFISR
jgi:hypothetical protein